MTAAQNAALVAWSLLLAGVLTFLLLAWGVL